VGPRRQGAPGAAKRWSGEAVGSETRRPGFDTAAGGLLNQRRESDGILERGRNHQPRQAMRWIIVLLNRYR